MKGLSEKQKRFIAEYIKDNNGTQAAIRAGYSEKGANIQAQRLLSNATIKQEVERKNTEINNKCLVDAEFILRELINIASFNIKEIFDDGGNLKNIKELDDKTSKCISSIDIDELAKGVGLTRKIRTHDKLKALELLGRNKKLFTDKIEMEVNESLFERVRNARERVKSLKEKEG